MQLTPLAVALPLSLLLASAAPAQSSIERLDAVADASADADQPSTNFGSISPVTCGKTFTNTPSFRVWMTRGHFLFDLSSVSSRPLPLRARLRVYQSQASAAGCLDIAVHRVTQSWSESTLTWLNKPAHDPAALASACVGDSFDLGWKDFDVTSAVHAWLQGGAPNYGLVIRDPSESPAGAARPLHATSRESAIIPTRPQLELSWGTLPFGTGCGPNNVRARLDLESGAPALGGTYELRATNLASGAVVAHWVGISDSTWNGVPLPLDLGPFGFNSCTLLASLELQLSGGPTDSRGRALLSFTVPRDPFLRGRRVFHQALTVDATPALALTNGFAVLAY